MTIDACFSHMCISIICIFLCYSYAPCCPSANLLRLQPIYLVSQFHIIYACHALCVVMLFSLLTFDSHFMIEFKTLTNGTQLTLFLL